MGVEMGTVGLLVFDVESKIIIGSDRQRASAEN
jgi:hypothetical protein